VADQVIKIDPLEIQPDIWKWLKRYHSQDKVASAYLFAGPEGSGKEAIAIAFAKLLNCEAVTDQPCDACPSCQRINVLQHENLTLVFPLPREGSVSGGDDPLKGLSNKTMAAINEAITRKARDPFYKINIPRANTIPISTVREIRKSAYLKTAVTGRRIILIFDAHLLGTGEGAAANALLKILEEPPAHVKFIFATTEPNKVLATIQSRCQRYDFRNISIGDIANHLKTLLNQEQVAFEDDLVLSVAKMANGSMRDGLSLLDRLISTGVTPLSTNLLEEFLGQPNIERIYDLIDVMSQQDAGGALTQVDALIRNGLSEAQIVDALIDALRDLMIINTAGMQPDLVALTQQQTQKAEVLAGQFDAAALIYRVTALEKLRWTVKNSDTPRALLEASILRFTLSDHFINIDTLLTQLNTGQGQTPAMGAPKKKQPLIARTPSPAPQQTTPPPAQPPHNQASPVPEPRVPQAPPASQDGDIQTLRTQWQGLLDSLAKALGPSTTTLLSKACPAHWKNGTLTLEFDPSAKVQKGMCENSERADAIKHALQQSLNARFHLVFTLQEQDASPEAAAQPADVTAKEIRQKRNDLLNEPGVKAVLVGLNATVTNIEEKKEPE